jgi:hypothetical protein
MVSSLTGLLRGVLGRMADLVPTSNTHISR